MSCGSVSSPCGAHVLGTPALLGIAVHSCVLASEAGGISVAGKARLPLLPGLGVAGAREASRVHKFRDTQSQGHTSLNSER